MKQSKILITSALPYANGPLHFGHIAGAYLPGDCYARFERLQGCDVLYICGSDEHGVAITLSAELAGRTPKAHVDHFHAINEAFFQRLGFSFDHYSRTTWPGHVATTQQFFRDLLANGYIEEKVTEQLYSEQDAKFLADRYVVGSCPHCGFDQARGDECQKCGASYEATDLKDPRSKITGAPLVRKPTNHWFLRFDLFKDKLQAWLKTRDWKPNVLNFAKHYVDELKPRAITRDSDWGIPVPLSEAKGKVFYVWFDAPIGYISATQEWAEQKGTPKAWEAFWLDPATKYVQFIGKDNIPFHAVFFPAMEMGQNIPYKLVDELPANEFLNLEGKQFSKSEGWTIDLERFFQRYTTDQIRYTIAANAPESQDAEFTWKDFQMRCNSELLGKYGNFANRTLIFAQQHCGAAVPALGQLDEADMVFQTRIIELSQLAADCYKHFQLRKASQTIMELAQAGNVYFDAKKPWVSAKTQETRPIMQTTVALCLEALKTLSLISFPIIPETAAKLWKLLGFSSELQDQQWNLVMSSTVPVSQKLPVPSLLFQRVEDAWIQEEIELLQTLSKKKTTQVETPKTLVTIDEVRKLELKVARILHVERVPKSNKLLKLRVDLGGEERTIVAGIGHSIEDLESLIGRHVAVVANLKPAKLMGIESQGMLLAVSTAKGLEPLNIPHAVAGDLIS
ncbi:MAG: methionine--tRNA ligase [Simkania sp.]|nr:methionine--tRNA ligase [Simkania sp.]